MYKKYEGLFVRLSKDSKGQKFLSLIPKSNFFKTCLYLLCSKSTKISQETICKAIQGQPKVEQGKKGHTAKIYIPSTSLLQLYGCSLHPLVVYDCQM